MTKIKGTENVPSKPAPKPRKTGRPCTVCRLDALKEIDAALLRGEGFVDLARRYAVSQDAVERHYARHMPIAVRQGGAEAAAEAEGERGSTLLDDARSLRDKVAVIMTKAEQSGNFTTAIAAARELARLIELQGRLSHEIDTAPQLNIMFSPTLIALQNTMMAALVEHPAAKQAVLLALTGIGKAPLLIEG